MGGGKVPCLVDTGSIVSTVSDIFFTQHLELWGQERLRSCHWLELSFCDKLMPRCGVLVVRDSPCGGLASVPGVLGMNVIHKCYQELFRQHGTALFSQLCVSEAPRQMAQALQQCHCTGARGQE